MITTHPLQPLHLPPFGPEDAASSDKCMRQFAAAKRELGAFVQAVSVLFGGPEAESAAARWLELVENSEAPEDEHPNWRQITIATASELANGQLPVRKHEMGKQAIGEKSDGPPVASALGLRH
jgi:hypothetical protein